jgi:hypothetical protein
LKLNLEIYYRRNLMTIFLDLKKKLKYRELF